MVLVIKNPAANAGDAGDLGLIPGSGRFSGGEHANPLQYSCLENPTDRGAWRTAVHMVEKSWTRLKQLSTQACTRMQESSMEWGSPMGRTTYP